MSFCYKKIVKKFEKNVPIILDSGVSTELERRGARMRKGHWSGCVSIDDYEKLVDTHLAYIEAGADIITINSYASSRLMLEPAGLANKVKKINKKNIDAAFEARERSQKNVTIAGSISHALPFVEGVEGAFQQPIIPKETLIESYTELIKIFEVAQLDLILLEMMSIPSRMIPLFECAKKSTLPIWCGLSAKRKNLNAPLSAWHDDDVTFDEILSIASDFNFEGMGIMHTSVDVIEHALKKIKSKHGGILMAYPDSGYFAAPNWQFEKIIQPEKLLEYAIKWKRLGCNVFGGCCGLGPEHTRELTFLID